MSDIDLKDYVLGGYFVLKYSNKGFWRSPLLPENIFSISDCIGNKLDKVWGSQIEKPAYRREALEFGILENKLKEYSEWDREVDAGSLDDLQEARRAIKEFFPTNDKIFLVGAGLHSELIDDFLDYKLPPYIFDSGSNHEKYHRQALSSHLINQRIALQPDGTPLGFEIVSYEYGWGHSWLCGGLEKDMNELFGIRPNQYGLIDSYAEAKQVYEWIAEDKLQGTRAEPEPYFPWLIVQYPVN